MVGVNKYVKTCKVVDMPEDELKLLAECLALERGGRTVCLARQFIDGLLSKYFLITD